MLNYDLSNTAALVKSGIIKGIPIAEYHKSAATSKSQLDQFAKSPAHYLASLTTPRKETPAMRIGSIFHGMVLEPDRVKIAVAPQCDKRTKEGKATWEAFCLENAGAEIVTAEEGEMLNGMRESVMAHPAARATPAVGVSRAKCNAVHLSDPLVFRLADVVLRHDLSVGRVRVAIEPQLDAVIADLVAALILRHLLGINELRAVIGVEYADHVILALDLAQRLRELLLCMSVQLEHAVA